MKNEKEKAERVGRSRLARAQKVCYNPIRRISKCKDAVGGTAERVQERGLSSAGSDPNAVVHAFPRGADPVKDCE